MRVAPDDRVETATVQTQGSEVRKLTVTSTTIAELIRAQLDEHIAKHGRPDDLEDKIADLIEEVRQVLRAPLKNNQHDTGR